MTVTLNEKDGIKIVVLTGSFDSSTVSAAQEQVLTCIKNESNVILDMINVEFLSSSGLRMLLLIYREVKTQNGQIVLVGVIEEIRDVMENTGFINYFVLSDTLEEAIKILKNS